MRRLWRYLRLRRGDPWLLLNAYVAIGLIDIALRGRGFQRVIKGIELANPCSPHLITRHDIRQAWRYARRIRTAARWHVVRARCLHRSLVLHRWLRRKGLPSELRIGVRMEGESLKAHAWVELGGQPINERPGAVDAFTALTGSGLAAYARTASPAGQAAVASGRASVEGTGYARFS